MKLGISLTGEREVMRRLEEQGKKHPEALGAALYQEGMGIWHDAVKRAPVEFGVLRNSAYVSPPMQQGGEVTVEVGFGTEYAVAQHEGEGFHHPRGGEAGYLQKAIVARQPGFLERLAERTDDNVKKGIRAPAVQAPTTPAPSARGRLSRRIRRARAARRNRK